MKSQIRSTVTLSAYEARAERSSTSPVSTAPFGSATATTSASTADPRLACARNLAVRRASGIGSVSTVSHVLRKRLATASRAGSPVRHSMSTAEGMMGGQRFCSRKATISAAARRFRAARRLTPPASRTSTGSAGRSYRSLCQTACDRLGSGPVTGGRGADLCHQVVHVPIALGKEVLSANLGGDGFLEQFGGRKAPRFDLLVEFVR